MALKRHLVQLAIAGLTLLCWACSRGDASPSPVGTAKPPAQTETVVLAGGCFWCLEAAYDDVSGVVEAVSGYTGGHKPNPTYQEVSAGDTGHYEAVRVTFDPAKNASNVRKHGVSLSEADGVLEDPLGLTIEDARSTGEQRMVTLGVNLFGVLMVVVWAGSPDEIRVISVRRAEPGERRAYEEGS